MWNAIKYTKDKFGYGVQVEDPKDGRLYWIDVSINEKFHDIECDWNQYIFNIRDAEDKIRQATQDDCDNFDDATSSAICYLELNNQLIRDDKGNWFANTQAN